MPSLRELQARLSQNAVSQDRADHCYTFTLETLSAEGDVLDRTAAHLRGHEESNWIIGVEECGFDQVQVALHRWLSSGCDESIERDIVAFFGGSPDAVVRVVVGTPPGEFQRPFYECAWDDFVIAVGGSRYFLHLGVSD